MKTIKSIFRQGMNQRIGLAFFSIVGGLYLAAISTAQIDTPNPNGGGTLYTVSGNVKADGANLAGASVVLIYNGSIAESATTDASGNYSLNALEGFNYTASVYKDGYNFNPSYQILNNVQSNLTVNFQNGTQLCLPAPAGQTGGNFCQNQAATAASQIQNGKIAFEIFGNSFAVNANGSNQMQLPPAGSFPSWSPDGTKLLYNRTTSLDADQEIYITNADGTGNRKITYDFTNEYKANWSPDGTRAVFFRLFNSSDAEIFTVNTDSPNGGVNEIQLTNDACLNRDPTYSPDGAKIAFAKICESGAASGIYTMDAANGANPAQLTSGSVDLSPAWRPDGSRLVFARDGDLWFVNASGTSTTQLTFDLQFSYFSPIYSPDGTKIAFSRAPTELEFQEIYTLNPESGEQIRLTNNQQFSANKEYPSWQRILSVVPVTLVGGLNLTFSNVTNGGNTVATPIAPQSAGALPPDFQMLNPPVAFDIRTSARFVGDIEVCFDVPNAGDETVFNTLIVFHNEAGALVDRTSSRNFAARKLCATVAHLSPFVVAAPNAPTAAGVTVSGRVLNARGQGLTNAIVSMIEPNGVERTARTTALGHFRFEAVEAGRTYIFGVRAKRYQFPAQVVTVAEDSSELSFIQSF